MGTQRDVEPFRSIHIDLDHGIFEINGERIPVRTTELHFEWTPEDGYGLELSTEKVYAWPFSDI